MSTPLWFVKLLKHYFPYRYKIAGWSKNPFMRKLMDWMIFKGDDGMVLPKEKVIINQSIETGEDIVLPSEIVRHFIEKSQYRWVMNQCVCRSANQCKNYPIDLGCLFLGEAVLKINPRLGRLVSKEEALEHLKKTDKAGLVHLVGRLKFDSFWMGVGPGEKLMTICNCCPCCCLYGVLPVLDRSLSSRITRMPGVEVDIDPDLCIACGACTTGVCFVNAIQMKEGHAEIGEGCVGCGRCVEVCPTGAIQLHITDRNFFESTVQRISQHVDVS